MWVRVDSPLARPRFPDRLDGPLTDPPGLWESAVAAAAEPVYGNTNEAMGLRPGQPTEMRSDVPSHVTSVTTTTTAAAAIAIVRRRGMV